MTDQADTRLRRLRKKGKKDFAIACSIADAAFICHVGIVQDDQPYVLPMAVARDGDRLLLHGSVASRLMKHLDQGLKCCVTITHLDGLVLARSAFNSSMHYRSLMVFGTARQIIDPAEKERVLEILTEHLLPGRLADIRPAKRKELNATLLLELPLETWSVKISDAPPDDPASDLDSPAWAGVLPLSIKAGKPVDAPDLRGGIKPPAYLRRIRPR